MILQEYGCDAADIGHQRSDVDWCSQDKCTCSTIRGCQNDSKEEKKNVRHCSMLLRWRWYRHSSGHFHHDSQEVGIFIENYDLTLGNSYYWPGGGLGGGRSPVTRRIGERDSSWSGRVRAQSAQRASDPSGRRRLALVRLAFHRPVLAPLESTRSISKRSSHWLPRRQLHHN